MKLFGVLLYNLILIAGTAYLVAVMNWSAWWFVLTVCLLVNYSSTKASEEVEKTI